MSRVEFRLQRRVDHPAADLARRRAVSAGTSSTSSVASGRRCAAARSLWAMKAWNASAVVAKPPGTETPRPRQLADHLAERGILAADLGQVGQAQVVQPQDVGAQGGHSGFDAVERRTGQTPVEAFILAIPPTPALGACLPWGFRMISSTRPVFYVSDGTGITAETIGHSLLTQFTGHPLRHRPHSVRRHRRQGARRPPRKSAAPGVEHGTAADRGEFQHRSGTECAAGRKRGADAGRLRAVHRAAGARTRDRNASIACRPGARHGRFRDLPPPHQRDELRVDPRRRRQHGLQRCRPDPDRRVARGQDADLRLPGAASRRARRQLSVDRGRPGCRTACRRSCVRTATSCSA